MPDLRALSQPSTAAAPSASEPTPAPDAQAVPQSVAQPNLTQANAPAYGEPGAAQEPSTVVSGAPAAAPTAPPPHARLLKMIQGLSAGLTGVGAFGTALATRGKEGGIQEVEQVQAAEQARKIQAQQAATEQKNAALQQAIGQQDLNAKTFTNHMNLLSAPETLAQNHLTTQEKSLSVTKGKLDLYLTTGMTPEQADQLTSGGPVDAATSGIMKTNAQQQLRLAAPILKPDNPALVTLQKVLADPDAKPQDLLMASRRLETEAQGQKDLIDVQQKQNAAAETAPLGDKATQINAMTEQRYQVLNPGKPLPDAFKVTAASTPADARRIADSLSQTEAAQGTKASRDLTNEIHQQTLDLLKGPQGIPADAVGPDYVAAVRKVDPGQADLIEGYGQGRLVLSPNIARSPQGVALTKEILRAYPNYIAAKADGYQKQYLNFTEGKVGTAINAYSTSLDHLNDMFDNVANASLADLNAPTSKIHQQLDVDKNIISSELAKAVSNGSMTEGEKDQMLASVDGKILGVATKDKYQNQLREVVRLLGGKLNGYQSQWASTAVPGSTPPSNLVDAANATKKLAGAGGEAHVIDIGGVHYIYNGSGDTADLKNYTKK